MIDAKTLFHFEKEQGCLIISAGSMASSHLLSFAIVGPEIVVSELLKTVTLD